MHIAYWATNAEAVATGMPVDPKQFLIGTSLYLGMFLMLWLLAATNDRYNFVGLALARVRND